MAEKQTGGNVQGRISLIELSVFGGAEGIPDS
jgi:hypothetical protein